MNPLRNEPAYAPVSSQQGAAGARIAGMNKSSASNTSGGGAASMMPTEAIAGSDAEAAEHERRQRLAVYDTKGKLVGESNDEQQAEFLREVVLQSQRHGRDIESTIQYLNDMLRKKTVECEGLRTLAQENYDPVRRAVRREYEARVESENRQQTQMRTLLKRVEELQAERQTLQQEVASLKSLVSELERRPPPSSYSEFDGSLFNRVIYDDNDDKPGAAAAAAAGGAARNLQGGDNPSASWNLGQGGAILNAPRNQSQRDVIAALSGLDSEVAKGLESAQVFDFIKAVLVRMCTKNPATNAFPDVVNVITTMLRERRNDPHSVTKIAQMAIPVAQVSDRQRVTQLFLANNPGQLQELEMLLTQYNGREDVLYEQLKERFYSADGRERVANNLAQNPSVIMSTSDAVRANAVSTDPGTELHARIMLMYKKYNPQKLMQPKELNKLLSSYPAEIILASMVEKYGPEPSAQERRQLLRELVEKDPAG